jgi:hypothetical protein
VAGLVAGPPDAGKDASLGRIFHYY